VMLWRFIGMASLSLLLAGTSLGQQQEGCPHDEGWTPADLDQMLSQHEQLAQRTWKEREEEEYRKGIVAWSRSYGSSSEFWKRFLEHWARGPLYEAQSEGGWLEPPAGVVNLCNANLRYENLQDRILDWANLNGADLSSANLTKAKLRYAELKGAKLISAKLKGADLSWAKLSQANLKLAKFDDASLSFADLTGASLVHTSVKGARLSWTNLSEAFYSPQSQPPDPHVAGIRGLETVNFSFGEESGVVQIRDLAQRAGLRDLERKATFAIEHGKTFYSFVQGYGSHGLFGIVESLFRMVAFELTTGYGLYPGRALMIIGVVWLLLSGVYFFPIHLKPKGSPTGGIYQVWQRDRIEPRGAAVTLSDSAKVNRLKRDDPLAALGYAAYFSLLSAFHIGWRDLNVGTWIARIQPREYALRAVGWVRVVSGVQSLLSVYLVALWALTYFGRPFQ
jgi:uncharacterized protein YjbI with pentapeptide repeats